MPKGKGYVKVGGVTLVYHQKEVVLNMPQIIFTGLFASVVTAGIIMQIQKLSLQDLYGAISKKISAMVVQH